MNTNKIILSILCTICLFVASCSNDDESEIRPIYFKQQNYTIRYGVGASISFENGGGI